MKLCIPEAVLKQHVVVLGKTGAGKSSALRHIVEHLLDHNKRVCIIDPKGDWAGLKTSADGKGPGYPVIGFGDFKNPKATDVPINEHSGKHVAELIASGNRPCIIGFRGWMTGKMVRFWIDFASTLFNANPGELYLVGDEFHNFAPKGKIMDPEAGKCLHWSNRLLSEGRGYGLVCLIASQRPQKVHNDTLTCCETLVAMRVVHKADRDAIEDWIEGCGDKEKGREVLNALAGMARGEAYVWSPEIDYGPKRITFPMFETFDSFAPPQLQRKVSETGWSEVNLDEVKTKLAAVIEDAKANDPAQLKREISELRRTVTFQKKTDVPVIRATEESAMRHVVKELQNQQERIDQWLADVKHLCEGLHNSAKAAGNVLENSVKRMEPYIMSLAARLGTFTEPAGLDGEGKQRFTLAAARQKPARIPTQTVSISQCHNPKSFQPDSNGSLGKGARQILIAIAQHEEGVTDNQIAVLTGYKKTSRTTFKQQLKSHGYMAEGGRGFVATKEGIAWLGDDAEKLPTGDALRNYWMSKLTGGERQLFEHYVRHYPNPVSTEEMMEHTRYKKNQHHDVQAEIVCEKPDPQQQSQRRPV